MRTLAIGLLVVAAAHADDSFRITVDSANRFGDPYSPTHRLRAERRDGELQVTLSDTTVGTGDLELFLLQHRLDPLVARAGEARLAQEDGR